jgi:hypothetical protein
MSEYKRDHPRIRESLQVELITQGDKKLFATTFDVSKRGVQLSCDGVTVQEIFGGPGPAPPAKLPTVILKLRLNHSGQEPEQIEAECKAVFARRIAEEEYRVGLLIHSLSAPSRVALDRFVDQWLERN